MVLQMLPRSCGQRIFVCPLCLAFLISDNVWTEMATKQLKVKIITTNVHEISTQLMKSI